MTLLAAVVGYALPSTREEPRRLPVWLYRALAVAGPVLVAGCLAAFGTTLRGLAASIFCLALVVVTVADLEYRLIPNRVVLPASPVVLATMTVAEPDPEWVLSAVGAALTLLVLALVYPAGMGMGDVKLAFLMGAALGLGVLPALAVACVAAAVPAVALLVRYGRKGRKMGIPFGPFLAFGSLVALFAGA